MVTKLQRIVEMVEDHHLREAYVRFNSPKYKHARPRQFRGSIMDATPKEMEMIYKISIPMDKKDSHHTYNNFRDNKPSWRRLVDELSSRSKNA